jgi:hypothetical protein
MDVPGQTRETPDRSARVADRTETRSAWKVRLWSAAAFLACAAVLGLAWRITPDPRGYGTHEQLGLAPCGMIIMTGLPCPTCGMTTAFAHTVRGQWARAFLAQPSGFILALATIAAALLALWCAVTGRVPPIPIPILTPLRMCLLALLFFVGGWAVKILYGLATGALPAS